MTQIDWKYGNYLFESSGSPSKVPFGSIWIHLGQRVLPHFHARWTSQQMMLDGHLGVYPILRHKMSCFIKPSGFAVSFPLRRRTTLWRSGAPGSQFTGSQEVPADWGWLKKKVETWRLMRWNPLELIQATITWVCWVHDLAYFPNGKSTFDRFPWRFDLRKPKMGRLLQIAMTHGSYLPDFKRDCWWFINVKPMNTRMIWLGWLNSWVSASNLPVSWSTRRRSMLRCEADDFFVHPSWRERIGCVFFFRWVSKNKLRNSFFSGKKCNFGLSPFFEQTQIHWSRFNKPPQFEATSLLFRWFKIQVDWLGSSQRHGGTLVSIVVLLHSSDVLDRSMDWFRGKFTGKPHL